MAVRGFYLARKMENGAPVLFRGEELPAYTTAQLPEYQTRQSAGADFFCAKDVTIPSIWKNLISRLSNFGQITFNNAKASAPFFQPTFVHTGVKASMEEDEVLLLYNRSSNPKKLGLVLANSVGVVDADYFENPDNDGEICFAFYNFMPFDVEIKAGDRIGQGVFQKFLRPTEGLRIKNADRAGGFGSTDKH